MLQKGSCTHGTFVLRDRGGPPRVSGDRSAFFGYTAGAGRSGSDDGIWARWNWDGGSFELRNDRFGFYPLYYFRAGNGFGISDSVVELLRQGAPGTLDDDAIAVFLRAGFYLGDDTPFRAIRAVPPAARLRWSAGDGLRVESRRLTPGEGAGSPPTRADAVRRFGALFQSAMDGLLPGEDERVAMPLSGGRDSRHILLALLRRGRPPDRCVTARPLPPRPDEDAHVASGVARALGLPHEILPRTGDRLHDELRMHPLTDFCTDEHTWLLPLGEYLRDTACTLAFDGIGGDVLSAGLFLTAPRLDLYARGELDALAEDILGPEGPLPRLLRPPWYRRWSRAAAVRRLARELEKYRACPNPVGQFYFWNRTRREITLSPWRILNGACTVVAPYLSGDVYDFLAALPAAYFLDHAFHTDAIAAHYPDYAHLPYETGAFPRARTDLRTVAAFAAGTARRCLPHTGAEPRVTRASFLLPILLKGVLTRDRGARMFPLCIRALYLHQLLRLTAHSPVSPAAQGAHSARTQFF